MSAYIGYPCGCEYRIHGIELRLDNRSMFKATADELCDYHKQLFKDNQREKLEQNYKQSLEMIREL